MSFDLEVARRIVKEMRAADWLKYEDECHLPRPEGRGLLLRKKSQGVWQGDSSP